MTVAATAAAASPSLPSFLAMLYYLRANRRRRRHGSKHARPPSSLALAHFPSMGIRTVLATIVAIACVAMVAVATLAQAAPHTVCAIIHVGLLSALAVPRLARVVLRSALALCCKSGGKIVAAHHS